MQIALIALEATAGLIAADGSGVALNGGSLTFQHEALTALEATTNHFESAAAARRL